MRTETLENPLMTTASKPPAYRAMVIASDDRVVFQVPLPVRTDEAAKVVAQSMADVRTVEVWDGLRFIERFDP